MRYITDFHIHSKYSRACSCDLVPEKLHEWAQYKGIDILGTGDFTHPLWIRELEEKLEPVESGLYRLQRKMNQDSGIRVNKEKFREVRFILTAEVSSIYSQGGKMRRMHTVLAVSSFEAAKKIAKELANIGNLTSDGRPILGLSAKDLARICFDIEPTSLVIPAHAWTPWFSVFGSKSGFNSLAECYEELAPQIFAIETGLSSDPEMNWRLSALDQIALTSSSDAHSLPNLGREATVFDLPEPSYQAIYSALKVRRGHLGGGNGRLLGTIEFYPEEGKYHYDGHVACKIVLSPKETQKRRGICPVCNKLLTVGVDYRVNELADRPIGYKPDNFPYSKHIVPLVEIIANSLGVGKTSKKVQAEYWKLIHGLGNEFDILLEKPLAEINAMALPRVVEGIDRVRRGDIVIRPGYDGVYGVVKVFEDGERNSHNQEKLF